MGDMKGGGRGGAGVCVGGEKTPWSRVLIVPCAPFYGKKRGADSRSMATSSLQ